MAAAKTLPHARLPGKTALEREYVAGASFAELAEKYGVNTKTVNNTMRLRAKKAGTTWPLKQGRPGWEKRKANKHAERAWDSVTAKMIRLELQDIRALTGVTLEAIATEAGVSQTTVWQIHSGRRERCARSTAEKIMVVVERLEKAHRRKAQSQYAID